jgi:hypothetical protein
VWCLTCVPYNVYNVLGKFKPRFWCVQARHFWVFCWVLLALILDHGRARSRTSASICPQSSSTGRSCEWCAGQWDEEAGVTRMARDVLHWLPPPVELVIHKLKSGLHLRQMQVTNGADRVARSVALPVCAYLLLVRLYGWNDVSTKPWSLFQLKQWCTADILQEEVHRTEKKWQRKLGQNKRVA